VSDAGPRLIRTAPENAYVLTRPTLAVISPSRPESAKIVSSPGDAPVPKLRSRLVEILNGTQPPQRLRFLHAYGLAWEEARVNATGRVGEKGEHFEQPLSLRSKFRTKIEISFLGSGFLPEEERSVQPGDCYGDEFDRQQKAAHNGVRCGGR
jgi:hypothetical protein